MGDYAEVDCVRRIPGQHLGLLLREAPVHRLILLEAREPSGLGPDRLVQAAIDLGGRLEPGNIRGRRPFALDDDTLDQQQQC